MSRAFYLRKMCCWVIVLYYSFNYSFLLITGPFKVNGVPLKRVNQAYVIGTQTKVDISSVDVSKFEDKYFMKEHKKKVKKTEGEFFKSDEEVCLFYPFLIFLLQHHTPKFGMPHYYFLPLHYMPCIRNVSFLHLLM